MILIMDFSGAGRSFNLFRVASGRPQSTCFREWKLKTETDPGNNGQLCIDVLQAKVAQVLSIQQHSTTGRVVESSHQTE